MNLLECATFHTKNRFIPVFILNEEINNKEEI